VVKVGEEIEIVGMADTRKSVVTGVEMFRKLLDEGRRGTILGAAARHRQRRVQRGQVLAKRARSSPTRSSRRKCTC